MADSSIMRGGITLAAMAAVCTTLVAFTYQLTDERIAANEQAWLEQSLQPALAGLFFDSGVSESKITIPAPHDLPGSEDAIIYRAAIERHPGRIRAVVLRTPGPGLDSAGHRSIRALKDTGVTTLFGRSFDGFAEEIEAALCRRSE